MPSTSRWALPHRPALDGVRALAVIGVLLYHGGVSWLPGGFLGVDVFFVLSGFLITSLLLAEHEATGRVGFARFWFHRARRLLPALFAVLVFVCLYAVLLAPAVVRARLRGDLIASLFYAANWRFVIERISYFEQYASPTPLLHMWSLAIEEQFYVIWPLLLVVLLRFGWRGRRLAVLFGALAVASAGLMAALYRPGIDPSRIYYGTDTRLQALLVGAVGAVVFTRRGWWRGAGSGRAGSGRTDSGSAWLGPVGWLGLAGIGIVYAVAHDSSAWMYRGGFLLTALASLALVLGAASPSTSPLTRVLTTRPLVTVGVASYGIYLWHWPVYVVLTPAQTGLTGWPLLAMRLAVTGLLATLSYRVIETPIRRWSPTGPRAPWTGEVIARLGAATAVVLTGIVLATGAPGTAAGPIASPPPAQPSGAATDATPIKVYLLGDSVAFYLHSKYPPDPSLHVTVAGNTLLGCNFLGGNWVIDGEVVPQPDSCPTWSAAWHAGLEQAKPDVAVMMIGNGELFDHVLGGADLTFGTPEYAAVITQWLTATTADLGKVAPTVAITNLPCYGKPESGFDKTAPIINDVGRQEWLNKVITDFVAAHPDVHLLNLRSEVCPTGAYAATYQGAPLYEDGVHWTADGAARVWVWLAAQTRAIRG